MEVSWEGELEGSRRGVHRSRCSPCRTGMGCRGPRTPPRRRCSSRWSSTEGSRPSTDRRSQDGQAAVEVAYLAAVPAAVETRAVRGATGAVKAVVTVRGSNSRRTSSRMAVQKAWSNLIEQINRHRSTLGGRSVDTRAKWGRGLAALVVGTAAEVGMAVAAEALPVITLGHRRSIRLNSMAEIRHSGSIVHKRSTRYSCCNSIQHCTSRRMNSPETMPQTGSRCRIRRWQSHARRRIRLTRTFDTEHFGGRGATGSRRYKSGRSTPRGG